MAPPLRPLIGINTDLIPAGKHGPAELRLVAGYCDAVAAAGGLPVLVPPVANSIDLGPLLDRLEGFVLTGGLDLDPRRLGLPSHAAVQPLPERRDESDKCLVKELLDRRLPLLAIGLGMQQLNVLCGGTLYLHLPADLPRALQHRDPHGGMHRHLVLLETGSRLEEIYGGSELHVHSNHHQAVRQLGAGLKVAAQVPDRVVEAIEADDPDWFCIGVQWHPEHESATMLELQLFEGLIQDCLRRERADRATARRASQEPTMPARRIIGVAAGSGADGLDAALAEIDGVGLDLRGRIGPVIHQPFANDLRALLHQTLTGNVPDLHTLALLHRVIGETAAAAARAVADAAGPSLATIFCIGWKGFLLVLDGDTRLPSELRLGMTSVIAERTGITTVGDFAGRDLALGGQGGPLAALPDYLLFRHSRENRLLVHLGIATRLTLLPAGARAGDVLSFDAGPGTGLLDAIMRQVTGGREAYDPGGKHAVQGRCLEPLVERWLTHAALQRRPPRLFSKADFGDEFATHAVQQTRELGGTPHDLLCTATHFVARAAVQSLRRYLAGANLDRVLLSGGGVRNGLLLRLFDPHFDGVPLQRTDAAGVPPEGREAGATALLAALALDGVPGNLPGVTAAAGSRLLGAFSPGSADNWARCVTWMAGHAVALAAA